MHAPENGRPLSSFESGWLDDRTRLDRWLSPFRLKFAFWSALVLGILVSPVIWLDSDLWLPVSLSLGFLAVPGLWFFWVMDDRGSWKTSRVQGARGIVNYKEGKRKLLRGRIPTLDGLRPLVLPEGWEDDFPEGAFVEIEAFDAPLPGRAGNLDSAWWVVSLRGRRSLDAEAEVGCLRSGLVTGRTWWPAGLAFPILFGVSLFLLPTGVGLREIPGILASAEPTDVRSEAALRALDPGPGRALRLGNLAEIEQPEATWRQLVFLPESTSTEPIVRSVWWIAPDLLAIPIEVRGWEREGRIEAVFLRDSSSRNPWVRGLESGPDGSSGWTAKTMDRIWFDATWRERPDPILSGGGSGFDADFVAGKGAFAVEVRKDSLLARWQEAADRLKVVSGAKANNSYSIWRVDSTRDRRKSPPNGFRLEGGLEGWIGPLERIGDRVVSVKAKLQGRLLVADGFVTPNQVFPCQVAWFFLALAFFAWIGSGVVRQLTWSKTEARARKASFAFWGKEQS